MVTVVVDIDMVMVVVDVMVIDEIGVIDGIGDNMGFYSWSRKWGNPRTYGVKRRHYRGFARVAGYSKRSADLAYDLDNPRSSPRSRFSRAFRELQVETKKQYF